MTRTLCGHEKDRLDAENNYDIVYVSRYKKYLGEQLEYAKGKDISMAQFAEECGVSPSTFTKIKGNTAQI